MDKCSLCDKEINKGYINILDRQWILCEKCKDEYGDSWEYFDEEDQAKYGKDEDDYFESKIAEQNENQG